MLHILQEKGLALYYTDLCSQRQRSRSHLDQSRVKYDTNSSFRALLGHLGAILTPMLNPNACGSSI
jgi:hypothetical protein